jgi:hypothetical protein
MGFSAATRYHLQHLRRLPLGTPYPEVVERVVTSVQSPALKGQCEVVVDATGVGGPVVDLLRTARLGCTVVPVTITGGDAPVRVVTAWRVPKRDLIVGLQVKVSAAVHDSCGAWRDGEHDDLVLGAALGCWRAKTFVRWSLHGTEPLPGM